LARPVKRRHDLVGQRLFQYVEDHYQCHMVDSGNINRPSLRPSKRGFVPHSGINSRNNAQKERPTDYRREGCFSYAAVPAVLMPNRRFIGSISGVTMLLPARNCRSSGCRLPRRISVSNRPHSCTGLCQKSIVPSRAGRGARKARRRWRRNWGPGRR
jgi:hypothetical protein